MKILLFLAYLTVAGVGYWLRYLNLSHLKQHATEVPPEFEGKVDPGTLRKTADYTFENSRVGLAESIVDNLIVLVLLFGGFLAVYDRWILSLTDSFITAGFLFLIIPVYAQSLLGIPFSLYRNFSVEARYGFNTMTTRIWIADFFKSLALGTILGGAVILAGLWIVQASPDWWWFWVWAFFLAFGLFVMYLSPYVIEPLFFKFEPLQSEGLEEKIRSLVEKTGLRVDRVFQVDASRRSRHSNAYFTGIGPVKRIVLFDTLVKQMTHEEILAVLAHEIGHWKKHHIRKRLIFSQVSSFAGLFLAYHLIRWDGLPGLLGYEQLSFYSRLVIVGFLSSLALFPFTPFSSGRSRKAEREADRFAVDATGDPDAMASALVKLSRENLSNLHPHPWYSWFYYSHPPVLDRIRTLRANR